jgi:2-C-methyl-D-erythritol 4-phosphate cytidylyltransferase
MALPPSLSAVIVAGGQGTRLGAALPKAFVPLGPRALVIHAAQALASHAAVSDIVIVVADSMRDYLQELLLESPLAKPLRLASGGAERWQSVYSGVLATPQSSQWLLIHDAARPFVTHAVIDTLLATTTTYRAAVSATPMVDTVREFSGECAGKTLDRSTMVRIGTPQLFYKQTLLEGFALAETLNPPPTDEAMLMEKLGVAVGIAWGDSCNFKITTPQDMELAEALYAHRSAL